MSDVATWVATLNNGHTLTEKDFKVEPGLRRPWVQLTELLAQKGNHLTSLRLNFKGRTIHMPRSNFGQFDYNDINRAPLFYSLCYHCEGVMDMTGNGPKGSSSALVQTDYIELAAHYEDFIVRYIQDTTDGNNSWVLVTDAKEAMASTPRRQD